MKTWTLDDLPPVLWNVSLAGEHGLGLSSAAILNYSDEVDRRIGVGARVLGTVKYQETPLGQAAGYTLSDHQLVSDEPLPLAQVPCLLSHWAGRKNLPGSKLAEFHRLGDALPLLRAARRLRRRQRDPVILGTGFPQALSSWLTDEGDHVDAVADYLEDGFALQVDDAMGRPEELGHIVWDARAQSGFDQETGIVMFESTTLSNRARWITSDHIDLDALRISACPSIISAESFGRSVILKHGVTAPQQLGGFDECPVYLLATGRANLSTDEVQRFSDLGYDRWVLQGVGLGSAVAAKARELLRAWRASRPLEPGVIEAPASSVGGGGR